MHVQVGVFLFLSPFLSRSLMPLNRCYRTPNCHPVGGGAQRKHDIVGLFAQTAIAEPSSETYSKYLALPWREVWPDYGVAATILSLGEVSVNKQVVSDGIDVILKMYRGYLYIYSIWGPVLSYGRSDGGKPPGSAGVS